jgi:HD-like signal output (HDOD) protein
LDEKEITLIEAERQIVGMDHAEIGRLVCRKWNFPEAMADSIGSHHDPESAVVDKVSASIIHIADHIARTLGLDSGLGYEDTKINQEALTILGLEDPLPSEILEQSLTEYERANIFVGLIT